MKKPRCACGREDQHIREPNCDSPLAVEPRGFGAVPEIKGRQLRTPAPRAAVRVAAFERSMEAFNAEMAQKVAQAIHAYHVAYVEPLEKRLAETEGLVADLHSARWWRRFFRRAS